MKISWDQKFIFGLSLGVTLSAQAVDSLHDNMGPFDSSTREYTMIRPSLFKETNVRTVFIRRDKINLAGLDAGLSVLSGTGSTMFRTTRSAESNARANLQNTTFENVSGKGADTISEDATAFKFNPRANITSGIDFTTAASLAKIAKDTYLKFPLAAPRFAKMGFKEQRFVVGVKTDSEGVVLKNKDVIVLAFRGTEPTSTQDWISDLMFFQVPVLQGTSPQAHIGFYQATNELFPLVRAEIVSTFENKLRRWIAKIALQPNGAEVLALHGINSKVAPPDDRPIYLTGHSLGGAIATLMYGEFTLAHLDRSRQGYYFNDPTLANMPDTKIDALVRSINEEESEAALAQRTFSFAEQDVSDRQASLAYLAVIQNESSFVSAPVEITDTVTVDSRMKGLYTFGAPRSMDAIFKFAAEKYASATGSIMVRFENFYVNASTVADVLQADLIPRVPGLIPGFMHAGIRSSFESDQIDDFSGNLGSLKCEYSSANNEHHLGVFDGRLANLKFSIGYHDMLLYSKRVDSYKDFHDSSHSCSKVKYERP